MEFQDKREDEGGKEALKEKNRALRGLQKEVETARKERDEVERRLMKAEEEIRENRTMWEDNKDSYNDLEGKF